MKSNLKYYPLTFLLALLLFSCTNSESELNLQNQTEINEHPAPLEYISEFDNAKASDAEFDTKRVGFMDKQFASTRSSCPAADHANTQYEWAAGINDPESCTYTELYCGYLTEFWYAHLITAYADCDIGASCSSYNWAINSIGYGISYWESEGLHPFYVDNLYEQLDMLIAAVANVGC